MASPLDLTALARPSDFYDVLEKLGFGRQAIAKGDKRNEWVARRSVTKVDVAAIEDSVFVGLGEWWQGSFQARLLVGRAEELDLLGNVRQAGIEGLNADLEYDLELRLDKRALIGDLGADSVELYLAEESFQTAASAPYRLLERDMLRGLEAGTVTVVHPGEGVSLDGEYLAFISFDRLENPEQHRPAEVALQVHEALNAQRAKVNRSRDFAMRTPLELEVRGSGWDTVAGKLASRLAVHNALVFLADSVHVGDSAGTITATIRGHGQPIEIAVGPDLVVDHSSAAKHSADLVRWVFSEEPDLSERNWLQERRSIAQSILHQELRDVEAELRGSALGSAIVKAAQTAQWHWERFLAGELERHSASVEAFAAEVESHAFATAARTSALASGVLDALRAAVVTILGSFLGAVLSSNFNAAIFRVGLVTYTVYLVLFAGVVGLGSALQQFTTSKSTYEERKARAEELLSAHKVEELEGTALSVSQWRFKFAFCSAIAIYLIVAVASIWAIVNVPSILAEEDPLVFGQARAELTRAESLKVWPLAGLGVDPGELRAESTDGALSLSAMGPRQSDCRLEVPRSGDAVVMRNPFDDSRFFLIIVEADAQELLLSVTDFRGEPPFDRQWLADGCMYLGQEGLDWERPSWSGAS